MTEMPDGSLWVASRSGIIGAGDPRSGRFRTAATLTGRGRFTAVGSWETSVLVGTSRGLAVIESSSGREVPLDAALAAHRLGDRPIGAIRSLPGVAWIASGKELFRVGREADGRVSVTRLEVPIAGSVSAISPLAPGRLWIGSDRGEVVRVEWSGPDASLAMRAARDRRSFGARLVRGARFRVGAARGSEGRLWVGTRRGLGASR